MPYLNANGWIFVLRGIAAVVFGVIALSSPGDGLVSLARLFGGYAIVDGALNSFGAFRSRPRQRDAADPQAEAWWSMLVEGVVSLVFGIVIAATAHRLTPLAFFFLVGPWAILTGVLETAAAFSHGRRNAARGVLAGAGAISIIGGLAFLILATAGVPDMRWLITYTILFGLLLIVLGFSLSLGRRERSQVGDLSQPATA